MAPKEINLNLTYTRAQEDVFFKSKARRRVITKGRRLGFTQGASQAVIEFMLDKKIMVLWGDTIHQNIVNYIDRYFMPVLKQLPTSLWKWEKQAKQLHVANSVCDFRSADNPENWEGFGYDLILLNEAGIILKNRYLWENAVRPMLLDKPDSIAILGGTPKGRNLHYELWMKGQNPDETSWESFTFTTYDNPFISHTEIEEMKREMPESVVRQEIYGEFIDGASNALIPYSLIENAMAREAADEDGPIVWALDVARHGDDMSVLVKRSYRHVTDIIAKSIDDTMQLASWVADEYSMAQGKKPSAIFVEVTGLAGWGVVDRLKELRVPVAAADVSLKSNMQNVLNKRAEMYRNLLDALKKGLKLPDNKILKSELTNVEFEYDDRGNFKLVKKDEIKKIIGHSPDRADAVALTYYEKIAIADNSLTKYDELPALFEG